MNWDDFRDPVFGPEVRQETLLSWETIQGEVARISDVYPSRVLELSRPAAGVERLTFFPHPWWPALSTLPGAEVWVTLQDEGWNAVDIAAARVGPMHWQVTVHDRFTRSYATTLAEATDPLTSDVIERFTRLPFGFHLRAVAGVDKIVSVRDLPHPVFATGVAQWAVQLGFEPRWPPES